MFPNLNWSSSFAIKIVLMLGFWILGMATEHLHVFIWEIDSFSLLQPWRCKREALNILNLFQFDSVHCKFWERFLCSPRALALNSYIFHFFPAYIFFLFMIAVIFFCSLSYFLFLLCGRYPRPSVSVPSFLSSNFSIV